LGPFEPETTKGYHGSSLVLVASFVNARRARGASLGFAGLVLWQLAACGGRSRSEVEFAGGSAGTANAASGMSGGGMSGSGTSGAAGSATAGTAGDCPLSVEFDVSFDDAGVPGPPNLCAPCAQPPFTLLFGDDLPIDQVPPNCSPVCDTCQVETCHSIIRCGNQLASTPYATLWSGLYYEPGSCDSGDGSESCKTPKCAPPGEYWAEFCAPFGTATPMDGFPNACALDTPQVPFCTIRGFTLPADGPVPVILPLHAL